MAPLGLLSTGEKADVIEIKQQKGYSREKKENFLCHMEDMGIRPGKTVEVLSNEGRGPILVKVDESRIALGRGIAMKIMVRRKEN